jgi:uncharacterized membrane protein YkoI
MKYARKALTGIIAGAAFAAFFLAAPAFADGKFRHRGADWRIEIMPPQVYADDDENRQGRGRRDHNGVREGVQAGRFARLEMIIEAINAQTPGRLVGVQGPRMMGGRALYRIMWETRDGRVIPIVVDARSGQILGPGY